MVVLHLEILRDHLAFSGIIGRSFLTSNHFELTKDTGIYLMLSIRRPDVFCSDTDFVNVAVLKIAHLLHVNVPAVRIRIELSMMIMVLEIRMELPLFRNYSLIMQCIHREGVPYCSCTCIMLLLFICLILDTVLAVN